MTDNEDSYNQGLRDGRIQSIEAVLQTHEDRLDRHERMLHMQERITYGLLGAIALIQIVPTIQRIVG